MNSLSPVSLMLLKRAHLPKKQKQRGVVLFFALICLLVIMLAAVALVRSVDTNTIIAGNLALEQAATRSGDLGTESAINWLVALQNANSGTTPLNDAAHPFNQHDATNGYYASVDPNLSLTASSGTRIQWTDADSSNAITDSSGNVTRYVVQRLCRTAAVTVANAGCLYGNADQDKSGQNIPLPQEICNGPGCPSKSQGAQMRVTSKTTGPKNTVTYVQTFVY